MKVLVTGANGFLGAHLVRELLAQNHDVYAMLRKNSDRSSLANYACHILQGDLDNPDELDRNFSQASHVFHVAGVMSASPRDSQLLHQVNVQGAENVVRACEKAKVQKLVHVSSVVAVGASLNGEKLLNENSENTTQDLGFANYDSKRRGEEIVLRSAREGRIDATVVNPSLMYGARDAKKAMRKGNVLAAKGMLKFYTCGGVNVVPVEDVAKGMIAAAVKGRSGERYLLTGENMLIKDLLKKISNLAQAKEPEKELPAGLLKRLAQIHDFFGFKSLLTRENIFAATSFHWYDNTKAKEELGFQPGSAEAAIRRSVEWMKENGYLEK